MSHTMRRVYLAVVLLGVALAGCQSRTEVTLSGSTPSQYSHVFVTTQEVWFNNSATATPQDTSWAKFTLTNPVTVDLVTESGGTLGQIASDLHVTAGTYSQVRLIPVDASAPLTASAQAIGATFNEEVDYIDIAGNPHQLPLELPNPGTGIGIQTSLTVPVGNLGVVPGTATATSTSTITPAQQGLTTPQTTTTSSGAATTTIGTTSTTTGTSTTVTSTTTVSSFAIVIDGSRDLALFTFGPTNVIGALLSAHPSATDLSAAGAISGQLTLTNLPTSVTSSSNRLAIQATAESLSADGSRHVVVASAPVNADGSFTIYPLASNSSNPTTYDVVIHGPQIATIIVKTVAVAVTPPTSNGADTTSTSVATTTATTPVSIGTLVPRSTSSFLANITAPTTATTLPAGATVNFYQQLRGSNEVPYVIEEAAIDPFNRTLQTPVSLSTGTIDSGTFVSSGTSITLTTSVPQDGTAVYRVAGTAPSFADGTLSTSTIVTAPSLTSTSTTPVTVAVPTLALASGATAATLTATITSPGTFDQGELILSHDGAVIATAPLDPAFKQGSGSTITVSGLPGGTSSTAFDAALYDLSVRAWSSTDPAGTLRRQFFTTPVDLRTSSTASATVAID